MPDLLTPDMDRQDAEAVLLALGPVLTWGPNKLKLCQYEAPFGDGKKAYGIHGSAKRKCFYLAFLWSSDGRYLLDSARTDFATVDDAKAACEYHHANGKWQRE